MRDSDSLFIYGSLSQGMVHFAKIAEYVEECSAAYVKGTAFRLPVGFPVVLAQGFSRVPGILVKLRRAEILFRLLDEFHGVCLADPDRSLFFREETLVEIEGQDGYVGGQIYFLNPRQLPKNAKLIEDGDWRRSLREAPALTERLTERQRTYIMRLGRSSGRDIVPIDLSLYRELINLDIVVDKGRRLALTPLGHEVLRYLG